jgi:hypothetical protein
MEDIYQRARSVDDLIDRMNKVSVDDAILQINHDQRGVGVKNRKWHRVLLLG